MPVQPALRAEWKRRMRFLNAILAGERPKGDPKSYVRLRLINILPDGSYQVTPKGRMYAKPETVIRIPILDFYAGDYRLEYDGKYVTLFGKDKNYKGFKFNDEDDDWFEEMVLIPVVEEIRNASPKIIEVTDTDIVVDLGCP